MSNEKPIEIYVDDLGGIMLGQPISKLTFVTMQQNGNPNDAPVQMPRVVVTMTTQALINACKTILKNIEANREILIEGAQQNLVTLTNSLSASPDSLIKAENSAPKAKKNS